MSTCSDIRETQVPGHIAGLKTLDKNTAVCTEAQQPDAKQKAKTYNSGYSLVVTHLTTNPPVRCLNRAERTGSLVFNVLWSYVKELHSSITIVFGDGDAGINQEGVTSQDPDLLAIRFTVIRQLLQLYSRVNTKA